MIKQFRLYIKGDVIGVGFRAWTKIKAKMVGVGGWVKNIYEKPEVFGVGGGVEALLQGEEKKVEKLINIIRRGPPVSRVDEVEVVREEIKGTFDGFEIKA